MERLPRKLKKKLKKTFIFTYDIESGGDIISGKVLCYAYVKSKGIGKFEKGELKHLPT